MEGRTDHIPANQPIRRLIPGSAIAHAVEYFIAKDADVVTGQVLAVNGARVPPCSPRPPCIPGSAEEQCRPFHRRNGRLDLAPS